MMVNLLQRRRVDPLMISGPDRDFVRKAARCADFGGLAAQTWRGFLRRPVPDHNGLDPQLVRVMG